MMRARNIVATEHHNVTFIPFDLVSLARSSLSHSSHWSCWGAGRRIPGPDAVPGVSSLREVEDTTAPILTLCCDGAVPGRGANIGSNFDRYCITG